VQLPTCSPAGDWGGAVRWEDVATCWHPHQLPPTTSTSVCILLQVQDTSKSVSSGAPQQCSVRRTSSDLTALSMHATCTYNVAAAAAAAAAAGAVDRPLHCCVCCSATHSSRESAYVVAVPAPTKRAVQFTLRTSNTAHQSLFSCTVRVTRQPTSMPEVKCCPQVYLRASYIASRFAASTSSRPASLHCFDASKSCWSCSIDRLSLLPQLHRPSLPASGSCTQRYVCFNLDVDFVLSSKSLSMARTVWPAV
jgi:hypothetical protein